ncbi:MAG: hypothetical protein EBS55_10370 [Flavobacteriaceae bacterium]|nr:hypothetical protein [Flavobacteriaceae bacterium]
MIILISKTVQFYTLSLQSKCSDTIFCKIKVIKLVFQTKKHEHYYNLKNVDCAMLGYLTIAIKKRGLNLKV